LLNRLDRGVVYAPDKAQRAKENFFKEPTLAALREMALRQAAHEVEVRADVGEFQASAVAEAAGSSDVAPESRERILIHVTDVPATAALIRRGKRVADYLRAECFAVAVIPPYTAQPKIDAIEQHLDFARKLHIETRVLPPDAQQRQDEAEALVTFAHMNGITQIFLAKPEQRRFPWLRRQLAMRVIRLAQDIQVTVVADRSRKRS
jgi:two-component system sensor histidine kinase KdpD